MDKVKIRHEILRNLLWEIVAPLVVCGLVLRFLSPLVLPQLFKITKELADIKESICMIKQRLAEIEPIQIKIKRESRRGFIVCGTAQISKGEGEFVYISKKLSNLYKIGERLKISNQEVFGEPTITLPIKGIFQPEDKNVIIQVSEISAKKINFSLARGNITIEVQSAEDGN